jgi:hypothetical protein
MLPLAVGGLAATIRTRLVRGSRRLGGVSRKRGMLAAAAARKAGRGRRQAGREG